MSQENSTLVVNEHEDGLIALLIHDDRTHGWTKFFSGFHQMLREFLATGILDEQRAAQMLDAREIPVFRFHLNEKKTGECGWTAFNPYAQAA